MRVDNVRVDNVTLTGCTVSGLGGVHATSGNLTLAVSTSSFTATAAGQSGVVQLGGDVNITNCVFDGFSNGMSLQSPTMATAVIANTTLANLVTTGMIVAGGAVDLRNSMVVGSSGTTGISLSAGSLTHYNNLIHGFSTSFSGISPDDSELLKPPRFVDAAAGDFHLDKGSPAINAGDDLSGTVPTDLDGNSRPAFNSFDMGAYEYISGNGSFRVLTWGETQ
jgi:hypothetical protein